MQSREAEALLTDTEVVPCLEAGLAYAKEIVDACLGEEIPAILYRDDHCTKGCSPKVQILVREDDVPRVAELMQRRFRSMAEREGVDAVRVRVAEGAEPDEAPCPACGLAAPLTADGACSDCGLALG